MPFAKASPESESGAGRRGIAHFSASPPLGPIQNLAIGVLGECGSGIPPASGAEPRPEPEPLRNGRADARLRAAGPFGGRDSSGRSPYRDVRGLPVRAGEPPPDARPVRR